jgi:hypothetical protein
LILEDIADALALWLCIEAVVEVVVLHRSMGDPVLRDAISFRVVVSDSN